ncbi:hypothetical protein [Sneathiella glossodoripedis]|uniref:hypothetical protein n=1 Tax=Sneathiella glossodoripedis TaxID=418853 RepID=UPI0004717AF6|nr:hypothetical protein [Sneathiella glossodoripedis]
MRNIINRGLVALVFSGFLVGSVQAAIISASGGTSSATGLASIVAAPADVSDDAAINTAQQGFDEAQGVVTSQAFDTDQGTIAAGTRVDSHMIFLNSQGNTLITHFNVEWTFSGAILGIMADIGGTDEAASSAELGAAGTTYPSAFANRGLEGDYNDGVFANNDEYSFIGNVLTLSMKVTEPGDWIRVVTVSAVPLPAALPLYAAGVALLGFLGWRKRKLS